ncbi:polypeptide n-acetylgalactosaminyltransferase [Plakobranchus ocellatus]|uniref:Polypeptide n-acetylgalactosaminyltransferase n=1 Tax=Plakobranchus ocellatus TaxID=259542 RepID=A0AAV4AH19_9GAST|nr:polypeptide n-acetylgalactosaminyltransferase [Plakobranchus ocellatus]
MRRVTLVRFMKRSLFFLPAIWLLYVVTEIAVNSNTSDSRKPWLQEEWKKADELRALAMKDVVKRDSSDEIREILNDKAIVEKKVGTEEVKESAHHTEIKTEEAHPEGMQLHKLAEMGGRLVKKKKPEDFESVEFPTFNDNKDWNGPGEGGKPYVIELKNLTADEKSKYNLGWSLNSFNQYASDIISIHRTLPDGRSDACKEQAKEYIATTNMLEISVVIIFHNEAFSVLLRSVHSILSRTPEHLLREIILVDDLSTHADLKQPLEKYFNDFPKVHIVRATKRQGLTRARLLGYFVSTAPVLVFLDSHIECFPMWAEPLLYRIHQEPTAVVFPSIEVIDPEHLSLEANQFVSQNGIFMFKDLTFNWQNIPEFETKKRKSPADPLRITTSILMAFFIPPLQKKKDWAEPLLQRIHEDSQAVPYPNIEIIRDDSLGLGTTIAGSRAIFAWKDLTFQWEFLPQYEKDRRKNDADPIRFWFILSMRS